MCADVTRKLSTAPSHSSSGPSSEPSSFPRCLPALPPNQDPRETRTCERDRDHGCQMMKRKQFRNQFAALHSGESHPGIREGRAHKGPLPEGLGRSKCDGEIRGLDRRGGQRSRVPCATSTEWEAGCKAPTLTCLWEGPQGSLGESHTSRALTQQSGPRGPLSQV